MGIWRNRKNILLTSSGLEGKIISVGIQNVLLNEMSFKELYKFLTKYKYYIFSFEDLLTFFPSEDKRNLKNIVSRWKKKGWICSLKRGLYELTYPNEFHISDMYVANKLYAPSYISLETALSNYSIIPEVSMAVTSVTTKPTRRFKNRYGLFIYRSVKEEFFTGYYVEKHGDFNILIAEPEKALMDFIYFRKYAGAKNFKNERINKEVIKSLNKKKMDKYAKLYNFKLEDIYVEL